jgi:hypothetical protein
MDLIPVLKGETTVKVSAITNGTQGNVRYFFYIATFT